MVYQGNEKKDASYINRLNKIEVLELIRESDEISRAEIVKRTNLSAPTVTRIVDSLINDQLAVMVGEGYSTGGRPPKLVRFDGTNNFVIGIDLGSTSIRVGISNLEGAIISEIETPTDLAGGVEKVVIQLADLIDRLIERSKVSEAKIMGAGLAVAGLINSQTGVVEYSPVFDWKKVDLKQLLKKHIYLPIYYDNVSRVTALGEYLYGIGKEHKNFICVNVGYGIGAGIIINGVPFFGSKGYSGEVGHIVLDRSSQYVGKDGIRGCLEALSSGYGIAEIAKIRLRNGEKSILLEQLKGDLDSITAKEVIEAALQGDPLSEEIFDDAMRYLGIGLDSLMKLFNPEAVVVSGGLTRVGQVFFDKLRKYTFQHNMDTLSEEVHLLPSSFADDATLIGALSLIISKILKFENGF